MWLRKYWEQMLCQGLNDWLNRFNSINNSVRDDLILEQCAWFCIILEAALRFGEIVKLLNPLVFLQLNG